MRTAAAIAVLFLVGCTPVAAPQGAPIAARIAAHPFWKKAPTAAQVDTLADTAVGLQRASMIYIDENFTTTVTDDAGARANRKALREIGQDSSPGKVVIDMATWPKRPTRDEVLTDLLDSLDRAEFARKK